MGRGQGQAAGMDAGMRVGRGGRQLLTSSRGRRGRKEGRDARGERQQEQHWQPKPGHLAKSGSQAAARRLGLPRGVKQAGRSGRGLAGATGGVAASLSRLGGGAASSSSGQAGSRSCSWCRGRQRLVCRSAAHKPRRGVPARDVSCCQQEVAISAAAAVAAAVEEARESAAGSSEGAVTREALAPTHVPRVEASRGFPHQP